MIYYEKGVATVEFPWHKICKISVIRIAKKCPL
jgi:hypothetical protein